MACAQLFHPIQWYMKNGKSFYRSMASSFMIRIHINIFFLFARKTTWHFPARINILFDKFQCDRDTLSWWPLDGRRGEFKDHWVQIMFLPIYLLGIRLAWPMTGGVLSVPYFFYVLPIFFSPYFSYSSRVQHTIRATKSVYFYFRTLLMAMPFFKCLNGQLIYIPNSGLTDDVGQEEKKNWA